MNVNGMKLTVAAAAVAATFAAGVTFGTTPFFNHAHAANPSATITNINSPSATTATALPDMSAIVAPFSRRNSWYIARMGNFSSAGDSSEL